MEAHMLTVTMESDVRFPFLTLLVSGGHCIICLAQGLGEMLDCFFCICLNFYHKATHNPPRRSR